MKISFVTGLMVFTLFFSLSCSKQIEETSDDTYLALRNPQGRSLLGKELIIPDRNPESFKRLKDNLDAAIANYEEEASEMNTIWVGRRYAYLSDYLKAVDIFSKGLEKFPNSYKLYRHRGHRYISLRDFDSAIADYEKAYDLMPKDTLEIEPDGVPNKLNVPLSNTQFNILYHYGLAHYLNGDFEKAEEIYTELLKNYCNNPDLYVATADWLYMTLRRQNKVEAAQSILDTILPDMEIIENDSYFRRLNMYKGALPIEELFNPTGDDAALSLATQGYGMGNWYLYQGDTGKAKEIFEQVVEGSSWAAFGYIATEADLARMK